VDRCCSREGEAPGAAACALQPGQYRFGRFTLDTVRSVLTENGRQIRLGSRAMSMLTALVSARGELVTRRQLIERAWPETFVEDSNLRVQISAVRRALGDDGHSASTLINVAGHGYRIGVPVEHGDWPEPATAGVALPPHHATLVVGRDREVAALVRAARQARLVTLTGPGGVGKSTIAAAAAQRLHDQHMMELCFVDFASVDAPEHVPAVAASALGLAVAPDRALSALIQAARARTLVLVFDTCEHVSPAVAALSQAILNSCPDVSVIATSHQALGLALERVIRVSTLATPRSATTIADVLGFPASELLVQRALAMQPTRRLSDADVPAIAAVCERLDGLPLAIEIAAANLDVLSFTELLGHVGTGRGLTIGNRRTASARHRSMRAMLDWATRRMSADEIRALHRLAFLPEPFDLQKLEQMEGADIVARLIRRNLLVPARQDGRLLYRLLSCTRLYAREFLSAQ